MKLDSHIQSPTQNALLGFAGGYQAHPLPGGMGVAWRADNVVLKPSPGADEAQCVAEIHANLPQTPNCRFQRPVAAQNAIGGWEIDGWVAWQWIDGETMPAAWTRDMLLAVREYHDLIATLPCQSALVHRSDPWARADRVAWGEVNADYPADYCALLSPLLAEPLPSLPKQCVHADLSGNVVLSPGKAPGIIDPTLYWRPTAFAEAIILVDQSWHLSTPDLKPFTDTPALAAMVQRAAARRIAEQPEQVAAYGKDAAEALRIARQVAAWTELILVRLGAA